MNDHGGHAAGDLVLQRIATRLRASVRGADAVVRLGGEEFVVLLHGCDADGGARVAEAVRVAIGQLALPEGARPGRLTASIGIASYPEHGDHLDELLAAADRAMYAAKHSGRNRVVRAPAPAERGRLMPDPPRPGRPVRVEIVESRRAG